MGNPITDGVLACLLRNAEVYGEQWWKKPRSACLAVPLISEDRHNPSTRNGIGRIQLRLAALRQPIEGKQ